MKKILKYEIALNLSTTTRLAIPKYGIILHTNMQSNKLFIWVLVDINEDVEMRYFQIYGTGHNISPVEKHLYVGTVFQDIFVWHLFERIN